MYNPLNSMILFIIKIIHWTKILQRDDHDIVIINSYKVKYKSFTKSYSFNVMRPKKITN